MVRTFLPTTKTEWLVLATLTALLTSCITAALLFRTIYAAAGVAAPVTITITEPSSDPSHVAVATRISRGGARFAMTSNEPSTWFTSEWVRAIEIQSVTSAPAGQTAIIHIGTDIYELPTDSLPKRTSDDTITSTITLTELRRTPTALPFFGTILNWPGDTTVLARALLANLLTIFGCGVSAAILILGYQYWIRRTHTTSVNVTPSQTDNVLLVGGFILSAVSVLLFIHSGPTAYDWPALDMGPFFMRAADSSFLLHDFFTNASAHPNPRFVFGYMVIGMGAILHLSWYSVFFLLKSLLVVFLPPALLVTLTSFFTTGDPRKKLQIIVCLFFCILAALFPLYIDQFTIALWRPYSVTPTPHAIAFFTGLIAIYLANRNKLISSVFFWILTTALLPTMGISAFVFYAVLNWQTITKRTVFYCAGLGIVAPSIFLSYWYNPLQKLSGSEFVYHYITSNHSIHYLPSAFETSVFSPLPWYIHFTTITAALLLCALIAYSIKNRQLLVSALLATAAYTGAVVSCYLFIEVYPTTLVAMIGPSRFTLFGYWFIAIFSATLIGQIPARYFPFLNLFTTNTPVATKKICAGLMIIATLVTIGLVTTYQDTPSVVWTNRHSDLATWIHHTAPDVVFASNNLDLNVNIPLVTKRAIFSGNGFPFSQDDFIAFDTRRALLYGSPEDWATMSGNSDRIKSDNFYRGLTPADFARIARTYQLDYVIIESSFSEQFAAYTPVFINADIRIYRVRDFSPSV